MNVLSVSLLGQIQGILKSHDVVEAFVFGSQARGEASQESDLDLLVKFKGEKSLLDLVSLKMDLEEKVGKEVDVVTKNSLHPLIREKITRQLKIL